MEKWISVEDKLPEPWVDVLCHHYNDDIFIGYFSKINGWNGWINANKENDIEVTHWQPLPEPPKED